MGTCTVLVLIVTIEVIIFLLIPTLLWTDPPSLPDKKSVILEDYSAVITEEESSKTGATSVSECVSGLCSVPWWVYLATIGLLAAFLLCIIVWRGVRYLSMVLGMGWVFTRARRQGYEEIV